MGICSKIGKRKATGKLYGCLLYTSLLCVQSVPPQACCSSSYFRFPSLRYRSADSLCLCTPGPDQFPQTMPCLLYTSYKAVNTMDSMVGYKNEKNLYFGRFAAKLDDVVNFIPSRVAALLMIVASFLPGTVSYTHLSGTSLKNGFERNCRKVPRSLQPRKQKVWLIWKNIRIQ